MSNTLGKDGMRLMVLLAEDDPNDVILIRRAFDRLAFVDRLMVVSDGEQTIAYLHGDGKYADRVAFPEPHLLFLDYRMPRLSGLGVICWLRSEPRFERLPIVILSGGFSRAHAEMAGRMQAACCPKMATARILMEAIDESVRRAFQMVAPMPFIPVDRSKKAQAPVVASA